MGDDLGPADPAPRLQRLEDDLRQLRDEIKTRRKDFWDKFASVSGLISGLLVTLIGFYATSVYNARQVESQRLEKDREISILRVQTIEKFFPHLASTNEIVRRAALDSIAALGDERLAAGLAARFGGESGASVLASLTKSKDPDVASTASAALSELFGTLRRSVVVIRSGKPTVSQATGFFVSSDGLVLVPSFGLGEKPHLVEMAASAGGYEAELIKRDDIHQLALLRVKLPYSAIPIARAEAHWSPGEQVVALGYGGEYGWISVVGRILGESSNPRSGGHLASDILLRPGMAGAPVVNTRGALVGVAVSSDREGVRFLIPAATVCKFVGS